MQIEYAHKDVMHARGFTKARQQGIEYVCACVCVCIYIYLVKYTCVPVEYVIYVMYACKDL
jgi:hypothetical protein